MESLTKSAKEKIEQVHALSREYNGKDKDHTVVLLDLIEKHAEEIKDLYKSKDDHFSVEVGDLLILCHELLIEQGRNADEIMELCYSRYERKLKRMPGK